MSHKIMYLMICFIFSNCKAITITFTCVGNHRYYVIKQTPQSRKVGPFTYKTMEKERYQLGNNIQQLIVEAKPEEIFQIYHYVLDKGYEGSYTLSPLGKKITIHNQTNNSVVYISPNNYQIRSCPKS